VRIITPCKHPELFAVEAVSTWANRGSGRVIGEIKRMSNIGPAPGTLMWWDGTYWKILSPVDVVMNTTIAAGSLSTSEQILVQATLPAGLLRAGRTAVFRALYAKDGTTDTATARLRLGSAGTTSDTTLSSSTGFGAANRAFCLEHWVTLTTATNLRTVALNAINGFTPGGGSSGVVPNNVTIPNADSTALILSAALTMSGTSNAPAVASLAMELRP